MNGNRLVRKVKKRVRFFWTAINRNNIFVVMEQVNPAYYYLLYDEEEIIELQRETIRQIRKILNENNATSI